MSSGLSVNMCFITSFPNSCLFVKQFVSQQCQTLSVSSLTPCVIVPQDCIITDNDQNDSPSRNRSLTSNMTVYETVVFHEF